MKVVALISGGKDSCYNMLLCQRYGHEVVALANLLPQQADTDELDSYMYQTVGHQVIGAYAACTGLPLFRRRILGHSKEQRLVYEDTAGDEVEDLAALLAFVKQAVPGIEAVSSGAIASDYQRTRVERVCARLGLVSLAFMWRQPQGPLLQRMIDAKICAVLVKVAAAGLRPDRHLAAPLSAMLPQLQAMRRTYGLNVCGEGGEYETLTLDCPLFTRGRLVLDAWQAVTVSPDSMAPVALLHPTAFHVEPKPAPEDGSGGAEGRPGGGATPTPGARVVDVPDEYVAPAQPAPVGSWAGGGDEVTRVQVQLHATCGSACVSLAAEVAGSAAALDTAEATATALAAALQRIDDELAELRLSWTNSLFVHLYLPSMAHFAAANAAYARFLPPVNPPSRATVQLAGNDQGPLLVVEVLLARPSAVERRVLHVQSVSEWAPSCIGPYSQGLAHGGLVHFAGQIPLDPATMSVVGCGDAEAQCIRSLASCQAVAVAMRTDLPRSMLWCTVYCSEAAGAAGREAAERSVRAFLRGDLPVERVGAGSDGGAPSDGGVLEEREEDDDPLDDYLVPPAMSRHWEPMLTFVTVPQLPRGAMVEIQPTAWARDPSELEPSSSDSDGGGTGMDAANSSCLPAWVRRVQGSHSARSISGASVQLSTLVSPGKFARLQAVVEAGMGDAELVAAAERAAQTVSATIDESGFSAGDIASAKLYYPRESAPGGGMHRISGAVAEALGGQVQPVVVPVSAVGANLASRAALVLELLLVVA